MKDPAGHIKHIFVEQSCLDLPYTRKILKRAGDLPVRVIADRSTPELNAGLFPENLNQGKRSLLLCRNRGRFLKSCPGTREYRCCGYQVLNIGMNCPMDCVYCILQAYLNNPWLSFFVNLDDLLGELKHAFAAEPDRLWRIGTGEFTDSMALDRLTGLSRILVHFMSGQKKAVLELKTKTANIDYLADLDHGGRTIVAWSLNSPAVMAAEEFRTATLDERLAAAACCAAWGYRLAFHFDPVIYHPGWQAGYAETISRLFDAVPGEKIAWISMGGLRFIPALKTIADKRFPRSAFFHEEFINGLDGKSRYFRTLRVRLYSHLLEQLYRRISAGTCVYLCMESDEVWRDCGLSSKGAAGLGSMLDHAAFDVYQ